LIGDFQRLFCIQRPHQEELQGMGLLIDDVNNNITTNDNDDNKQNE